MDFMGLELSEMTTTIPNEMQNLSAISSSEKVNFYWVSLSNIAKGLSIHVYIQKHEQI